MKTRKLGKSGIELMNILILGANGRIARAASARFLQRNEVSLALYLRHSHRLQLPEHANPVRVIEGDVLDVKTIESAMAGQDVVYANLAGDLEREAECIVKAMKATGIERLIFISSMGIYGEVQGQHAGAILDPYRRAADVIEASDLDYTILARKSVAALVVTLATTTGLEVRTSLGVHRARISTNAY